MPFRPVLLGSDLGVYSLARSFHETYGVRSTVVTNQPRGPINDSRILDVELAGAGASEDRRVSLLTEIAERHPGSILILLPCDETSLDLVERRRADLESLYHIAAAEPEALARARDKRTLDDVCRLLGLAVPVSITALPRQLAAGEVDAAGLTLPVVVKPTLSGRYESLRFEGKKKVYTAATWNDVIEFARKLSAVGFDEPVLVQEFIPGDDTWGRTVTCFIDRQHRPTLVASGQLLLGMHSPTMIGNSAAILTMDIPETRDALDILGHLGYTGFANFDLKVDPRDGIARFLDLNARIGRPNHYVTVAGMSAALAVVEDVLEVAAPRFQRGSREGVFSYLPLPLLLRYLREGELRRRVRRAWRGADAHPLHYRADSNLRRFAYRWLNMANLTRGYLRDYPRPLDTSL